VASPRADFGTGFGTVTRFLVGPDGTSTSAASEGSILVVSPKPGVDAGVPDAGPPDAGPPDAGRPDAGPRGPMPGPPGRRPHRLRRRHASRRARRRRAVPGADTCRLCHSAEAIDAGLTYIPGTAGGRR
jgi:hypothetical protein